MNHENEFCEDYTVIFTVGMLREALQNYPDDTMLSVCGAPGLLSGEEDLNCVMLETLEWYYEDNEIWGDGYDTYVPDYLDF